MSSSNFARISPGSFLALERAVWGHQVKSEVVKPSVTWELVLGAGSDKGEVLWVRGKCNSESTFATI